MWFGIFVYYVILGNLTVESGGLVSIGTATGLIVVQGCLDLAGTLNLTVTTHGLPLSTPLVLPVFSLPTSCMNGAFQNVEISVADDPCRIATYTSRDMSDVSIYAVIFELSETQLVGCSLHNAAYLYSTPAMLLILSIIKIVVSLWFM